MKKQFMKIFAALFALIVVFSFGVFPVSVRAQTSPAQEKTMYFMENVLPIDLSKYTIKLLNESTMTGIPLGNINRNITTVRYQLTSEESMLRVHFMVEKGAIVLCAIYPIEGEVFYSKQYSSQLDGVTSFLEKYQAYTKIDTSNLVAMLADVDITKDSTISTENTRLSIKQAVEFDQTGFTWTHTIDGVEYTSLSVSFDTKGNFMTLSDTRVLYKIVDTSINVSADQAIEIALEKLKSYSYLLPDGSVVKDFNVSDTAAMVYTIPLDYVNYELRPYWEIKLFLDHVYPGNVFGIIVYLWANTGEIISVSNMASGGINSSGNSTTETVTSSTDATSGESGLVSDLLVPLGITAAIIAGTAIFMLAVKKRKQQSL